LKIEMFLQRRNC